MLLNPPVCVCPLTLNFIALLAASVDPLTTVSADTTAADATVRSLLPVIVAAEAELSVSLLRRIERKST